MEIESMGREAFNSIYEANKDLVFRAAVYYSHNYYMAQDISQTVFLKLYLELESGIEVERVVPWILEVTKNVTLNSNQKSSREILHEDMGIVLALWEMEQSTEDVVLEKEYLTAVKLFCNKIFAGLQKENTRWYEAARLVYLFKIPQKEVAGLLGMDFDALYSLLYRVRKWIHQTYGDEFKELRQR